ncbi:hypothetical protein NHX12_017839 [Muraenolepis orangiensis]|uniref:FHA domain-containing protein n=1 Tax=Muraenolepis orangiensis TaxID=630683 RepID=A0A9Q0EVN4_9TELE|nr:hypothetical protein NHX12_017839 [Muraenolepis orangiensis]
MSLTSWFLVSGVGTRHRLPREMIFVGRDDCELMLQSRSVDKQHAVVNYEPVNDEHKVKDLGSLNGTFVNDVRIQEQHEPHTNLFTVMRGELHIPEEALKGAAVLACDVVNSAKPSDACRDQDKMAGDIAALHRGTPLYGQPAWWGDGDAGDRRSGKQEERERADMDGRGGQKSGEESKDNPSYFETPAKDHLAGRGPPGDAPSGDTEATHGHASFTIEFDHGACGKVTVKDHVLKIAPVETRPRSKRGVGEDLSPLQTAMIAAEVKVADWLAQNELPLALKETIVEAAEEDGESTKSDIPIQQKSLKGSRHEDGTQSDCEPGPGEQRRPVAAVLLEGRSRGLWGGPGVKIREGRANVPEGLFAEEDSPARRHRYLGTGKAAPYEGEVPTGRQRRGSAACRQQREATRDEGYHHHHHGDDHSDRVTYTIELENGDHEEEEARRMIDRGPHRGTPYRDPIQGPLTGTPYRDPIQGPLTGTPYRDPIQGPLTGTPYRDPIEGPLTGTPYRDPLQGPHRGTPYRDPLQGPHTGTPYRDPIEGPLTGTPYRGLCTCAPQEVFGVDEQHSVSVSRLGSEDIQRDRLVCHRPGTGERGKLGRMEPQVMSEELVGGDLCWASQWATLAASHIRTDPEGSGGDSHTLLHEDRAEISESSHSASHDSAGNTKRKPWIRPQLPDDMHLARWDSGERLHSDMDEKQDTELQEKEKQDPRGKSRPVQDTSGTGGRQGGSSKRSLPSRLQDSSGGRPAQESFTVERSSSNVPIELIPHIDGPTSSRTQARDMDSTTLQKDTEAVATFLETTVSDHGDPPSQSIEGSMSPESDVDTTSTVSQADGGRKVVQKRRTLAAQQKWRTVVCSSSKGPSTCREVHDRRANSRALQKASHPWTSMDLTDDDVNSNSLLSDSQPMSTAPASRGARNHAGSTTLGASTKSSRAKVTPATGSSKNFSTPKPRPTRASLLRRARHGDSSDTEPADFDRMSVASEASTASSASRTGMARKGMSRIEALAQPRRQRVGSTSAQSHSEATVSRSRGLGARSVAGDYAARQGLRGSTVASVVSPRTKANSASKLPDKVEYDSTSEDKYGSNRHFKQGQTRPFPSSQLGGSAPATPSPGAMASMRRHSRDQDEYVKDWTAHSDEISRISQDLAKDLAMLAREIHEVAGAIDSVSPVASDPGPLLEDSTVAGSGSVEDSNIVESNGRQVEMRTHSSNGQGSRSIRRQTWNRDYVVLEGLLLTSVTQLSARLRQSVDRTAGKIRVLFKDKERKWEDIETKLQAEHDSLLLKSSNKVKQTRTYLCIFS